MVRKDVLPNGVRVITEAVDHVQSVSIGFWVASGGRDETDEKRGISHFIEHMLFKGTGSRSARRIADEFDSIGGQLNAFTDKEYTCYYGKVLSEYLPTAFDVLSDMILNSVLDTKEMDLERNVVLEEIKRHEDTPDDLVHELFVETIWGSHPLGSPVLGSVESVSSLTRDDMVEYMKSRYTPDTIIVSAAGNLEHEAVVALVSKYFGHLTGSKERPTQSVPSFTNVSKLADKTTEQVHFCMGTHGFSHIDPERYTLAVIDTALGGGMSSRLFQEIREARGLAYAIGSYSVSYREGGFFTVYGGTSMENLEEVIDLVRAEFAGIRAECITDEELNRAKNQIRGGMVLSQESMSTRMIRMAKSDIYFGSVIPLEELIDSVLKVQLADVSRVADRLFSAPTFPIVAVGPFKGRKVSFA